MIKLAIFDWNGTLFGDVKLTMVASNHEFAVVDAGPFTSAHIRRYFEIPLHKYYRNMGLDETAVGLHAPAMHLAFHDYLERHVHKVRTRPGARQVLNDLHRQGITRLILSNHHVTGITAQLQRLKLDHHFEAVLANDDIHGALTLGKAQRLASYLQTNQFDAAQAFIIGDTTEEIVIGRSLGIKTVAITGGMNSESRLKAAKPDVLISSLRDLIEVIKEWNLE